MKPLLSCFLACAALSRLAAQESLFPPGRTGLDPGPEGNHYELGTVFRATVSGKVTHVRVYALARETGAHTARLWRNSDPDRDGFSNLVELALGGSPVSAASHPDMNALFDPGGNRLRATYRIREGTTGVTLTPQFSSDLTSWSSDSIVISGPVSQGDGTALIVVEDTGAGRHRFFRVLVQEL